MSCSTARVSMILEVHGEALARVLAILVEQPGRHGGLLNRRLELERELIVRLIGDLVVVGGGRDDESRVAVGAQSVDREDRRGEIGDVQPAHELLRQRRVLEVDDDAAAFLAHVDGRARIVELDDDLARSRRRRGGSRYCGSSGRRRRRRGTRRRGALWLGCAANDGAAPSPGAWPINTYTLLPSTRVW